MNKEAAFRQMPKIKECAERAGIGHALFLGYGTLLGLVRENDLIDHDDDTDFCVRSDLITIKQEYQFFDELNRAVLFAARRRRRCRSDNNRILWMSLKSEADGCKSCIWFQWEWKGYAWHSKGRRWNAKIGKRRNWELDYENVEAIAKGIPKEFIFCDFVKKKLNGEYYNIPINYGSALDHWYSGWLIPHKGGASTADIHCISGDWSNEETWKLHVS